MKHSYFPQDYTINFENNGGIPFITYLIGNNGAGKTLMLKNIADILTGDNQGGGNFNAECELLMNENEVDMLQIISNICYYTYERLTDNSTTSILKDYNLTQIHNIEFEKIFKLIYSRVEVNFSSEIIRNVTSKNLDDEQPKDISNSLNIEIPQLLVDIKAIDDSEISERFKTNPDKTLIDKPIDVGTRLDRFTNAFDKIYCGSKIFKGIENQNQQKVIIFRDENGRDVDISKFSSGEQQVLYRVGYLLKNLKTLKGGVILIDEPEISLHPIWQGRFRELLIEVFKDLDVQIIIATHSPYLFRKMDNSIEQAIKIDPHNQRNERLVLHFPGTNYTPSPNYISYIAYNIANAELHIELYEQLLIKFKKNGPSKLDRYLINNKNIPIYMTFSRNNGEIVEETLITWIRNKIHHDSDPDRPDFNENELKDSINLMISLLQQA